MEGLNEFLQGPDGATAAEPVFALDIGTRSVIGIVAVPQGDTMRILATETAAHTKRAVVDGQIEDINETARVADLVRKRLEQSLGITLRSVCVAAAGRVLRTCRATNEVTLDENETISHRDLQQLEAGAIELARESLPPEEGDVNLYCVGNSVIRYLLDDYPISTLLGHRGKRASVEIIATFLPSEVVESLYAAMQRIDLSISSITLEPIAAMNAVVPQELRMLNIVLVDIGAGTSDIAISDNGSVSNYTMATVAGDEITEAIMRKYLVEFDTAEGIKLSLCKDTERIDYQDILGFSHSVSPSQVLEDVAPETELICREICKNILDKNKKPPAAVFLAGGGSQLPGLCAMVARELSLDENKVAVGGGNYMRRIASGGDFNVAGPQFATPLGIAVTALQNWERDSFTVSVNGDPVHLFKNGPVRVMDVLLRCGWRYNQIIGCSGKTVTFKLGDEKRVVRGKTPTPAEIMLDGIPASLSTPVRPGCDLRFTPAVAGENARPTVRDVVEDCEKFPIMFEGESVIVGVSVSVGGREVSDSHEIHDLDEVLVESVCTISDLCAAMEIDCDAFGFMVNGRVRDENYIMRAGDSVSRTERVLEAKGATESTSPPEAAPETAAPAAKPGAPPPVEPPETRSAQEDIKKPVEPPVPAPPSGGLPVFAKDREALAAKKPFRMRVTLNGVQRELPQKEDGLPYQFIDMLNLVDIDPQNPKGNIVLQINGREASYLDQLSDGDMVDIYWEDPVTGAIL